MLLTNLEPDSILNRKQRRGLEQALRSAKVRPLNPSPAPNLNTPLTSKIILDDSNIPSLCQSWVDAYPDVHGPIPEVLPPFRDINHKINLLDESKTYRYYSPKCPDHFQHQL
jgi:hypothetical protein